MRERTAIGVLALAAMILVALVWSGNTTKRASAMERMAEGIRRAKSYTMTMDCAMQFFRQPGKPPVTSTSTGKWSWLDPGSYRMEFIGDETWQGKQDTEIFPNGKPGIDIDHKAKTFRRVPARRGHISALMVLDELSKFSGHSDRELGTKKISGKDAKGFRIDALKIDPDGYPGPVEVWMDAVTEMPLLVRYEVKAAIPGTVTMRDFQWNIDLDDDLFDTAPPEGYADATPKPEPAGEQLRSIVEGLTIYSQWSDGRYPQGKIIYGDVVRDELLNLTGIHMPPTREEVSSKTYALFIKASSGFTRLACILRDNPDAAYHGKTVGPEDAGKVLVRWQLEDGRYQVIYGDLHAEVVTRERLRQLEGK